MRQIIASADPDAPPRTALIPAGWNDAAAAALLTLVPHGAGADVRTAAERWIGRAAANAGQSGLAPDLAGRLRHLLLRRQGAPDVEIWTGAQAFHSPSFVLNLPAFFDPERGFDAPAFAAAAGTGLLALTLLAPEAASVGVGFTDLAGLIAQLGLAYDSAEARGVGSGIAALLRAATDDASAGSAEALGGGTHMADLPSGPAKLPDWLGPALARVRAETSGRKLRHAATTAIGRPGATEALLGAETSGIAPAFGTVSEGGVLTRAARAFLAARGLSPEAALAAVLAGEMPFPAAGAAAHAAMHDAVAPHIHVMPKRPAALAAVPPASRGRHDLPARHAGYTQKVTIDGHKLFLRTGEYTDGKLAEISVALPKEGPVARGLMEGLASAVSLGLQHGVPVLEYVDAFVLSRFGPAGSVEGDPEVAHASSMLDYLARTLAANYLNRHDLPAPELEEPASAPAQNSAPELPLDLPAETRRGRHALRLVSR